MDLGSRNVSVNGRLNAYENVAARTYHLLNNTLRNNTPDVCTRIINVSVCHLKKEIDSRSSDTFSQTRAVSLLI